MLTAASTPTASMAATISSALAEAGQFGVFNQGRFGELAS